MTTSHPSAAIVYLDELATHLADARALLAHIDGIATHARAALIPSPPPRTPRDEVPALMPLTTRAQMIMDDLSLLEGIDPAPESTDDVIRRTGWDGYRAKDAFRAYRDKTFGTLMPAARSVLSAIEVSESPCGPKGVVEATELPRPIVQSMLDHLSALGRVHRVGHGQYAAPTVEVPDEESVTDSEPPPFNARTSIDAGELWMLDAPPSSRRDVMARMGWGTERAGAALRLYRAVVAHGSKASEEADPASTPRSA